MAVLVVLWLAINWYCWLCYVQQSWVTKPLDHRAAAATAVAAGAVDTKQFDSDADRMFDWDDVILVDMRSSTPVQCPISLDSPPVCPQITPCGHVFSFGSIMRHLMTHGGEQLRRSAPCPLCYQPLVARELRLVQVGGFGACLV